MPWISSNNWVSLCRSDWEKEAFSKTKQGEDQSKNHSIPRYRQGVRIREIFTQVFQEVSVPRLGQEANSSFCTGEQGRQEGGTGVSQGLGNQWVLLARITALETKQKPGREHESARTGEHPG